MKYLVLIQARCGSTRLPGKVLKEICGKTVLQWVIERVQRSIKADEAVVVTSLEHNNLPLAGLCARLGVRVYAGAEEDVLDRYYQAAKLLKAEVVIRVTADCPLFDWRYLDLAVERMESETDYIGLTESFPDGLDLELFRFQALQEAWQEARLPSEREHVTPYIRKHPERVVIRYLECPVRGIGSHRWTLDEEEDFQLINAVCEHFVSKGKEDFVTEDILEFLDQYPQLAAINRMYVRNEGFAKSLAADADQAGKECGTKV